MDGNSRSQMSCGTSSGLLGSIKESGSGSEVWCGGGDGTWHEQAEARRYQSGPKERGFMPGGECSSRNVGQWGIFLVGGIEAIRAVRHEPPLRSRSK